MPRTALLGLLTVQREAHPEADERYPHGRPLRAQRRRVVADAPCAVAVASAAMDGSAWRHRPVPSVICTKALAAVRSG